MQYPEDTQEGFDDVMEQAKEKGFDVIQAGPNQLLLDLDTHADAVRYERLLPAFKEHLGAVEIARWNSKSGIGTHVLVQIREELPEVERILLQAALGSDGVRELLAHRRLKRGIKNVSRLFKPKVQVCKHCEGSGKSVRSRFGYAAHKNDECQSCRGTGKLCG